MLDIDIEEDVIKFVQDIQDKVKDTFDVYISGGYLRDNYCNLTPKDVDIFFVPKVISPSTDYVGYVPARCYVNYNKRVVDLTHTKDMQDRGVAQVVGLFNSKLSTTEIQFIVYDKPLTQQELAADMDMNLNQVNWSAETNVLYATNDFLDSHTRKIIMCLHEYDKVRMYERYNRMESKFPDYIIIGKPNIWDLPVHTQEEIMSGDFEDRTHAGSMIGEEE